MLTRDDLEQIRGIVREEVRSEVSTQLKEVRSEVSLQLKEVRLEVSTQLKEARSEVSIQLKEVKLEVSTQLKFVNRKLDRLQKDMTFIVKDYSNAISHLRKRVDRIDDHLDLPRI